MTSFFSYRYYTRSGRFSW